MWKKSCLVALATVLMTLCGCRTDSDESDSYRMPSIKEYVSVSNPMFYWSSDDDGSVPAGQIDLTNNSGSDKGFFVNVIFYDSNSRVVSKGVKGTGTIPAGMTETVYLQGKEEFIRPLDHLNYTVSIFDTVSSEPAQDFVSGKVSTN